MAVTGALLSLWITHQSINVFSEIGIIMLIGLITKNGILIVEFANQRKAEGMNVRDAVLAAATSTVPSDPDDNPGHDFRNTADCLIAGNFFRKPHIPGYRSGWRISICGHSDALCNSRLSIHISPDPTKPKPNQSQVY